MYVIVSYGICDGGCGLGDGNSGGDVVGGVCNGVCDVVVGGVALCDSGCASDGNNNNSPATSVDSGGIIKYEPATSCSTAYEQARASDCL